MNSNPTSLRPLVLLGLLLILLFIANTSMGSIKIPFRDVLSIIFGTNRESIFSEIIWQFRLPKAITCVLAGSALAAGGLMMQALFRNPLAGPDVLGLSAGASLAVAIVILAGASGSSALADINTSPWTVAVAASIGSTLVFMLIIGFAQKVRDNVSLLIIGLMISALTSSFVSVLQFLSKADDLQAFMIWTMGSVGGTGWREIQVLTIIVVTGAVIAFSSLKTLNAFLLGENYAQTLGINPRRSRLKIVLATSIMAGGVTAYCGPIAFVGLAVPHLIRISIRTSNHKILLPAVMLGGACLVLLCDLLAQLPGSVQILPLNAITSFIGAPILIWVILKNKHIHA